MDRMIYAASAALTLYAGAALAQDTQAAAGAQAIAVVGGSGGGSQRIHTTADAIAPGIIPSHPCVVVYSGGIGVTGFGVALGGGVVDEVCQAANFAAIMAQIGRGDLANEAAEIGMAALRHQARRDPAHAADTHAAFQPDPMRQR